MFLRRPPSSTPFLAPLFPCRRRFPNDWADRYQVCLSRDTHEWGADRLRDMQDKWEPTPEHMILMDVKVCTCLPAFPSFSPVLAFLFRPCSFVWPWFLASWFSSCYIRCETCFEGEGFSETQA